MAPCPKDAPSDAKGTQKKHRNGAALTTKEKIAAAEAAQKKAEAAEKKKITSKPRTLPPPGEAFRVTKPKPGGKANRSSKPITTKGKVRAATKAAEKKEKDLAKKKEDDAAESKPKALKNGKGAGNVLSSGFLDTIESQVPSSLKFTSKAGALKVTERPTEKTKMIQAKLKHEVKGKSDSTTATVPMVGFSRLNLMNLPGDVRRRIWELSVVDPDYFIWPDSKSGKEQPDLAMTCRSIRAEVLPIFYGKNVFAIDVPLASKNRVAQRGKQQAGGEQPPHNFEAINKWTIMLEKSGWIGTIRNWAFSHIAPKGKPVESDEDEIEDKSFVVSLRFVEGDQSPGIKYWLPVVELHQDARCILPGKKDHGQCIIETSPRWLSQVVIDVVGTKNGGQILPGGIVKVAETIRSRLEELVEHKCERVVRSIEIGQRGFRS